MEVFWSRSLAEMMCCSPVPGEAMLFQGDGLRDDRGVTGDVQVVIDTMIGINHDLKHGDRMPGISTGGFLVVWKCARNSGSQNWPSCKNSDTFVALFPPRSEDENHGLEAWASHGDVTSHTLCKHL
jgi:hypothetical protein